jgi:hypothetical protein
MAARRDLRREFNDERLSGSEENGLLLRYSAPQWVGAGIPGIPYVDK